MMYKQKFIASVKVNKKILREHQDTVYVPFGAEYSLLLKNLDSRRAIVNVYIDGTNVTEGGLVIHGKQEIDLERFLTGDLSKGNRFKFIEKTANIEKHRGNKVEDGLIRVEFAFEKIFQRQDGIQWQPQNNKVWGNPILRGSWTNDSSPHYGTTCSASIGGASGSIATKSAAMNISATSVSFSPTSVNVSQNDSGITVAGSESNQKFQTCSGFVTDPVETMIIRLLGELGQEKVKEAVTVKAKPRCTTCGRQNKATAKFCQECGTALEIIGKSLTTA